MPDELTRPVPAPPVVAAALHRLGKKADLGLYRFEVDLQDVYALVAVYFDYLRLRRGELRPEELQQLCHDLDKTRPGCTRADFEAGCRNHQDLIFGPKETDL